MTFKKELTPMFREESDVKEATKANPKIIAQTKKINEESHNSLKNFFHKKPEAANDFSPEFKKKFTIVSQDTLNHIDEILINGADLEEVAANDNSLDMQDAA